MVLVAVGGIFALLGLLPLLSLGPTVSFPQALVAGGLAAASVGAWIILYRPGEIVIDPAEATITLRSPIHVRRLSFGDVSYIELQPSQYTLIVPGLAAFHEERYDVVLGIKEGTQLAVHLDLTLSMARLKAGRLAGLIGKQVLHG